MARGTDTAQGLKPGKLGRFFGTSKLVPFLDAKEAPRGTGATRAGLKAGATRYDHEKQIPLPRCGIGMTGSGGGRSGEIG